jgi:hypothetical protein
VSDNPIPDVDPDEAERRQYAALTETLAGVLDLRTGLADAINVAHYAATSDRIAKLLDLPSGLRSILDAVTSEDETGTDRPPHGEPQLELPIPPQYYGSTDGAIRLMEAETLFEQRTPNGGELFKSERPVIRADVIADLLAGAYPDEHWKLPAFVLSGDSLVLSGVTIQGSLDLRGCNVRRQVLLRDCSFDEPLELEETTFASLRLSGCRLPGVHAPQLTSSGSIHLRDCHVDGPVDLTGVHVGGQLNLSGSRLHNPGAVAVLADKAVVGGDFQCHDGADVEGQLSLVAARIGGELQFANSQLSNAGGIALRADQITVEKDAYCRAGFTALGEVRLVGAHIGGQLNFNHATLHNAGGVALAADQLVVDQHLYCYDGFMAEGETRLVDARVGGEARFSSSTFANPGGTALRADRFTVERDFYGRNALTVDGEVSLQGAHIGGQLNFNESVLRNPHGVALMADHLVVGGHLYCHNGFVAEGEIRLVAAKVGGEVRLSAALLSNHGGTALRADRLVVGHSLSCAGSTVKGGVRLGGADIAGQLSFSGARLTCVEGGVLHARQLSVGSHLMCDDGFVAKGTMDLTDAKIGGEFNLNGATLGSQAPEGAPCGVALHAPRLIVGIDFNCRDGFTATGSLLLAGAHIDGHFSLTGASIVASDGVALDATGIEVAESVSCNEGFSAEGVVSFHGAHVAKNLDFRNARLACRGGYALDAQDLQADRMLMPKEVAEGKIVLRNVTLNELDDKCEVLPERIDVAGLSYETLTPPLDPRRRLSWLERSEQREGEVDPLPYEQMARSYRRLGYDNHARTVLLARERRLHAKNRASRLNWLWGQLQDKTVRYGYSPARAGVGFVALLLIGTVVFALYPPEPLSDVSNARFNSYLYTLELLIPIADFGQRSLWNPNPVQHLFGNSIVVLGWTLASIAVIGMTRVFRDR